MNILIPTKKKDSLIEILVHYTFLQSKGLISNITIIDFDNNSKIAQTCAEFHINYKGIYREEFNKSFALNIGLVAIQQLSLISNEILICDADVIIPEDVLKLFQNKSHVILDKVIETEDNTSREAYGIIKCPISDLITANGYDSNFKGWGFEDHDIIWRISQLGSFFERIGTGSHISHSDKERTQNYYSKDKILMRQVNKNYFEKKKTERSLFGTMQQDILKLNAHEKKQIFTNNSF